MLGDARQESLKAKKQTVFHRKALIRKKAKSYKSNVEMRENALFNHDRYQVKLK